MNPASTLTDDDVARAESAAAQLDDAKSMPVARPATTDIRPLAGDDTLPSAERVSDWAPMPIKFAGTGIVNALIEDLMAEPTELHRKAAGARDHLMENVEKLINQSAINTSTRITAELAQIDAPSNRRHLQAAHEDTVKRLNALGPVLSQSRQVPTGAQLRALLQALKDDPSELHDAACVALLALRDRTKDMLPTAEESALVNLSSADIEQDLRRLARDATDDDQAMDAVALGLAADLCVEVRRLLFAGKSAERRALGTGEAVRVDSLVVKSSE